MSVLALQLLESPQQILLYEQGYASELFTDNHFQFFDVHNYIAEYESRFPKVFGLFQELGMHPCNPKVPFDPYTNKFATESFTHIGEHSVSVAYVASMILDALVEVGAVAAEQVDWVVERALIHDINKVYEIMRGKAKRSGASDDVYSLAGYQRLKPLLLRQGMSKDVVEYVVNAGSETGHNSLIDFIELDPNNNLRLKQGMYAEKIVHLADDITYTGEQDKETGSVVTMILPPYERMLAAQFMTKYKELFKSGLGHTEGGKICVVADVARPEQGITVIGTYAELQVRVAVAIATEFQLLIDPTSDKAPELFIRDLACS